jgi:hypothetical protein
MKTLKAQESSKKIGTLISVVTLERVPILIRINNVSVFADVVVEF